MHCANSATTPDYEAGIHHGESSAVVPICDWLPVLLQYFSKDLSWTVPVFVKSVAVPCQVVRLQTVELHKMAPDSSSLVALEAAFLAKRTRAR